MPRMQVAMIASLFSLGVALQSILQSREHIEGKPTCYNGNKVYFVHVMKDGGESIDNWFSCLGKALNFSVKHANEGYASADTGTTSCSPSVCSAHATSKEKHRVCGGSFDKAKSFTALREPVSRIFSLYKYFKYHVKDEAGSKNHQFLTEKNDDGSERTFEWLLNAIKNKSIIFGGSYMYSDEMTLQDFAPNSQTVMMAHGHEAASMFKSGFEATGNDLNAAKRELDKLDAIFFTEQLDKWEKHYSRSGLPLSEDVLSTGCELPHDNEADCKKCPKKPTKKEYALAKELNRLDIELYHYAKTLKSARTPMH